MKLIRYYIEDITDNHAVVEELYSIDEDVYIRTDGGSVGTLHVDTCLGFTPKVGDEIELWIPYDNTIAGWFLTKGHTRDLEMENI